MADAFFLFAFGFEKDVISSIVVLHDIRVDGRFLVVEQDFGLSFKVAKIFIGVCPKDLVVGALSVVGQDRKVHHVFFCLLVVDGLRRPYADDVGEHRVSVFFREVYRVVRPVDHVFAAHQYDAPVGGPSLTGTHVGDYHVEVTVFTS